MIATAYCPRATGDRQQQPGTTGGRGMSMRSPQSRKNPCGIALFSWSERRAWDSNPRGALPPLAVFKTAAIGH